MARKLPPLHLLQLFEAAGRHLSFKKAAEELYLTPSAISHQIKALEEHLGIALFTRLTRGVQLTSAGANYLVVVKDVFQRLDQGTKSLKQRFCAQSLRISTIPSIASNIIIPRLGLFQQEFPDIELKIETSLDLVDLRYDECDLGIRLGDGVYPGLIVEKMFDLQVTPMCSPDFCHKHQLKQVDQISTVPLIQLSTMEDSWPTWGGSVGVKDVVSNSTLSLGSYDAVMQAAQQGLGLALGAVPLENLTLKSGRLVRPFKEQHIFRHACYAAYRPHDKDRRDISVFIQWFKQLLEIGIDEPNSLMG
jgi:LysR family glycine cleavage system transcriptional activator